MSATGYSSSYAVGAPRAGAASPATGVPYHGSPKRKLTLPSAILGAGCIAMIVGLVLVITGTPAKMAYDQDAAGKRVNYGGSDMMALTSSIDQNMKYIREETSDNPDKYNALLSDINESEKAIPKLAASIEAMAVGVKSIELSLKEVAGTTATMQENMEAMGQTTESSAATMSDLAASVGGIGASMTALKNASAELTKSMSGIESMATGIAKDGTGKALVQTKELNGALPATVPTPTTTLEPASTTGGGPNRTPIAENGMPAYARGAE